jgi:hypothetical protein
MPTTAAKTSRAFADTPAADSASTKTSNEPQFDIASQNILSDLFKAEHIRRTIKRMRAWQEGENEVSHPLRQIILLEYEEALSHSLSASVAAGNWRPSPSYIVLVSKRSGTYRELVFPCLIDTIVGRRIIDAMEPHITRDDNDRVFFGRSHANVDRARGDYENWFQVWLDYSSSISKALEADGYTYVFDTDITQFFPSVDRERAKHALAQRTQAHQTLLELLFFCIESWAPRVRYCAVPGLPIEPNDVSRLVAHNYIKGVDEHFVHDPKVQYLRWVDDTVIFVADEAAAHDIKRRHHLALREMGLSPNASKTTIVTAKVYGEARHPEFNRRLNEAKERNNEPGLVDLVQEWYAKDREKTPNWDKVATRLYSAARTLRSTVMRTHALSDVEGYQRVQRIAFKYLLDFDLDEADVTRLFALYGHRTTTIETRIEIARFLCDVRVGCDTTGLVNSLVGEIMDEDIRMASGYACSLLLLCLHKHGGKDQRERIRTHLTLERLQDDQLRLHYLYVFFCRGELDEILARSARHLDTPDIALLMRLCLDAREGRLSQHTRCLVTCLSKRRGVRTVQAKHLPFLHALLRAEKRESENRRWLMSAASEKMAADVKDLAVRRFLDEERVLATR